MPGSLDLRSSGRAFNGCEPDDLVLLRGCIAWQLRREIKDAPFVIVCVSAYLPARKDFSALTSAIGGQIARNG